MRKLLFILGILLPFIATPQGVKVKNLPTTTSGTANDYLIKDYYTGASGSTQKMTIASFKDVYLYPDTLLTLATQTYVNSDSLSIVAPFSKSGDTLYLDTTTINGVTTKFYVDSLAGTKQDNLTFNSPLSVSTNTVTIDTTTADGVTTKFYVDSLTSTIGGDNITTANLTAAASYTTTFTGFDWKLKGGDFIREGEGSTSATKTALFQNSSGVASLQIDDNGSVYNYGPGGTASNTAFGNLALNVATGANNTVFGLSAGALISTGAKNTVMGRSALNSNTTGLENVAVGYYAGRVNVSGGYNTYLGTKAGELGTGNFNTHVGTTAGQNNTGSNNVSAGYQAMFNATGDKTTAIGVAAGAVNTGSGVFLGYAAGLYETGSNKLFIDNAARTNEATARVESLIYGEFNASTTSQLVRMNADVEILHDLTFGEAANIIQTDTFQLASNQILNGFTTPITIANIPAKSGYAIRILRASVSLAYGTTAYTVGGTFNIRCTGADNSQRYSATIFNSTKSVHQPLIETALGSSETILLDNVQLQAYFTVSDPTTGDGTATGYITYEYVKL